MSMTQFESRIVGGMCLTNFTKFMEGYGIHICNYFIKSTFELIIFFKYFFKNFL